MQVQNGHAWAGGGAFKKMSEGGLSLSARRPLRVMAGRSAKAKKKTAPPLPPNPLLPSSSSSHPTARPPNTGVGPLHPPPAASVHSTVNLTFQPNQSVGIHFRWKLGFFSVDGFTDNSPAAAQAKGRILPGFRLQELNGVNLGNQRQEVVIKMMKELANQSRVLTFVGTREVGESGPIRGGVRGATTIPNAKPPLGLGGGSGRSSNVSTNEGGGRGAGGGGGGAEAQEARPRRPSFEDNKSTPARRRRIIYDISKGIWAGYKEKGVQAAVIGLRRIAAARIIQKNYRGSAGRRM